MIYCPKCGSGQIIGPRYQPASGFRGERLLYVCFQCGYSSTMPTLDAEKSKEATR